jgi:hypothetical protein
MTETKIFKLKIVTRLNLASILPEKSDIAEMIVKEGLRKKLLMSKKEISKFKISISSGGGLQIAAGEQDQETIKKCVEAFNDYMRQYQFDELETQLIVKQLKALQEKKEITDDKVDLYRWFIDGKPCVYLPLEPEEPEELKDYIIPEETSKEEAKQTPATETPAASTSTA